MQRILIVDDDQDLAYITQAALAQKGYEALVSHEIGQAMEEMKKKKPDLIIMDIMLPGISGAEAVRSLKKDPRFKDIPVIFLTGLISGAQDDKERTGIHVDGVVYQSLGKPYEIDELLKLVRKNLVKAP